MTQRPSVITLPSASALLTLSLCMPAIAQEPPEKLWTGTVEFGLVSTTGNSEDSTLKSRADATREKEKWRYNILLESLATESEGERTAEKYFASNRLSYQFTEHDFIFGYASYDDDRFSGFDYQATVSAGYGRRLINEELMKWDVGIGPGYTYNKVSDETMGEDSEGIIVSAFTRFNWKFSETSEFSQLVNVDAGDDNTVSKATSALKVQVMGSLALTLSYTIKYTETVPADTKHADTETAATLTWSF